VWVCFIALLLLGTSWRSNDTTKVHAHLFFLAPLAYFHALINQSNIKNFFTINLGSKNQVIFSFFYFLNQILNQLNHISSLFSFKLKNTNKLTCHLTFSFKIFSKTNKKYKTNKKSISSRTTRFWSLKRVRRQRTCPLKSN
jgi:hypothetical protein